MIKNLSSIQTPTDEFVADNPEIEVFQREALKKGISEKIIKIPLQGKHWFNKRVQNARMGRNKAYQMYAHQNSTWERSHALQTYKQKRNLYVKVLREEKQLSLNLR